MATSTKNWPKRPFLDFTQDNESITVKVGTKPNAEFKISKLRLEYYSPHFRISFASKMKGDLYGFVYLPDVCPKIFLHIIQYMNTESILIPGPPKPSDLGASVLQGPPALKTILKIPEWGPTTCKITYPEESLDLGTLARIWFLADYLMIPHVQNMAINLMYRRLLVRGTPPCYFGELVDAVGVALGTDGTVAKENNEVQKLFENYIAACSAFDEWTSEQRAMIPREILDGAMVLLRKIGREEVCGTGYSINKMETVGSWFVEDKLDGGKADVGLNPQFHYLEGA
ncbi:hypothetical protein NHQ30_006634 [Ciborinia camelliae]|nr:hypothetical protein NHQ30_006634 [Ciborinia camelliae]